MTTEPRNTHVDGYVKETTGQAVVGHNKTVHVNPRDIEDSRVKASAARAGLAQEVAGPSGISFLADGESAGKVYVLDDGRRVGMDVETVELAGKLRESVQRLEAERTPEAFEARAAAETAYKVAFAGSVRNYSLAEVHVASEAAYMVRPRSKEEQELRDLVLEARRLGDELGVEIMKPVPAYEEFMRANLRESLKTPEDAARYMLRGQGTDEDVRKILANQKPGFIQKRITKSEIKKMRRVIENARNGQS